MQIDLQSYPRPSLNAIHRSGMACVYVLSYESGSPCKIGYAKRPLAKITEIRKANAQPVNLCHLVWTPSLGMAMVIEATARDILKQINAATAWLEYPQSQVIAAVDCAILKLYPNAANIVPHGEMMKRLASVA